jgi:hypothetical protein
MGDIGKPLRETERPAPVRAPPPEPRREPAPEPAKEPGPRQPALPSRGRAPVAVVHASASNGARP